VPVNFLDRFPTALRARLMDAGRTVIVPAGRHLIRRGEVGGDLFLIQRGSFEVVDTTATPEIVLDVAGPGAVVGELAFVLDAVRNADVRAAAESTVLLWEGRSLRVLLDGEPDLAVAFYREVARTAAERMSALKTAAVVGGLGIGREQRHDREIEGRAHALSERAQLTWLEADARLRRDPRDAAARVRVGDALIALVDGVQGMLQGLPDPEQAARATTALSRDLRPFLSRTALADLALDEAGRRTGDPRLMAHALRGVAEGDGDLGRALDHALLQLPTPRGLRARTTAAADAIAAEVEARAAPLDVLFVHVHCGVLPARTLLHFARAGARVRAIDGSRDALAFFDAGLPSRPANVALKLVLDDLADLVLGRSLVWHDHQDLVVVDALTEYLPARLLPGLVRWVADHLRPGGLALFTGLEGATDAAFVDHALAWPMVRRPAAALARAVADGGLQVEATVADAAHPGVLVSARRPRPSNVR